MVEEYASKIFQLLASTIFHPLARVQIAFVYGKRAVSQLPTLLCSGLNVRFTVGRLGVNFTSRVIHTLRNGIHSFPAWRSAPNE